MFADYEDVGMFGNENIVNVDEPWDALLSHIETHKLALIRAPPKSGKSMLGELASRGRVAVVNKRSFEVRYCSFMPDYADFVCEQGFRNVKQMALDSGLSAGDNTRKTVVYFFDEAAEIPEDLLKYFVKKPKGYAVFACTSAPSYAHGYITPPELLKHSFFYKSPASSETVSRWLAGRFAALFGPDATRKEARMATELLLGVSDLHVGIIQYLGCKLEAAGCKNLRDVRSFITEALKSNQSMIYGARCFGLANGLPTVAQSVLVSMLRCSGRLKFVDASGCLKGAWNKDNRDHRLGLVQGLYAPPVNLVQPLVPQEQEEDSIEMGFIHMLQPELYHTKFEVHDNWRELCQSHRWVVNFSHSDTEKAAKLPTHVVDLVLSWLSNIATADLVYAQDRVDAKEDVFQRSLDEFCIALGIKGRREEPVRTCELRGFLDLLVNDSMGIELLIRTRGDNRYTATRLLQEGSPTWNALLEHASRTDGKYARVARACYNGYITVLPATLTTTTVEQEWGNFKDFIQHLRKNDEPARALEYYIMVAVAMPGWGEFVVFLHEPGKELVKFCIPRQRLLFKLVDGQLQSARHFYPRPKTVWVQEINVAGERMDDPFEVEPQEDSVQSLRKAILVDSNIQSRRQLRIHHLNHAGEWEVIPKKSQVLFANTEEKPYGFYVPE